VQVHHPTQKLQANSVKLVHGKVVGGVVALQVAARAKLKYLDLEKERKSLRRCIFEKLDN
jgi:hypothetical protein